MAPGVGSLPAAERDVPVAEPVARYLALLPRRTLFRLRLALHVFEWLPFPWRFSGMDQASRERYLVDMERSRSWIHHDLLLFMKILCGLGYARHAAVYEAVDYEARCAVREGTRQPSSKPLGDLTAPPEGEECDVVIVGSGAGGASAAAVLAEAGLDVIVLEAGGHYERGTYPEDPLEALPALYRDAGLTIAEGRPSIPLPMGRVVGGTTVVNSGTCFRAPAEVLAEWRDVFGVDWATRLGGHYAKAERFLKVTPVDVERMGRNGQLCMEGAAKLGASGGPIARNAGQCVQCGTCPFGCELDAKRAMHVSYLPRAVAAGARVRANVEVQRILIENGRAVGVSSRTGYEVRARIAVICAGGAVGTPDLMLRSGLGRGSSQLGRNLRIHPACWVGALYDEEVRGWDGIMQSYYVDEWQHRGILLEATFTPLAFGGQWLSGVGVEHQERLLRYDRVGSIGVHLKDVSSGRVGLSRDGSTRITYRLSRDDAAALVFGIARAAEVHFAAGAREVYPQIGRVPRILPGRVAEFEATRFKPGELRLEAFHPMGTARMAADPRDGVTGPDGAVHGTEALYVADASSLPSSTAVNPMMTIIAVATHIAEGMAAGAPPAKRRTPRKAAAQAKRNGRPKAAALD
jgi:choline dehydrogenase-like flavoprotein